MVWDCLPSRNSDTTILVASEVKNVEVLPHMRGVGWMVFTFRQFDMTYFVESQITKVEVLTHDLPFFVSSHGCFCLIWIVFESAVHLPHKLTSRYFWHLISNFLFFISQNVHVTITLFTAALLLNSSSFTLATRSLACLSQLFRFRCRNSNSRWKSNKLHKKLFRAVFLPNSWSFTMSTRPLACLPHYSDLDVGKVIWGGTQTSC